MEFQKTFSGQDIYPKTVQFLQLSQNEVATLDQRAAVFGANFIDLFVNTLQCETLSSQYGSLDQALKSVNSFVYEETDPWEKTLFLCYDNYVRNNYSFQAEPRAKEAGGVSPKIS